jgi:hypothetical protein
MKWMVLAASAASAALLAGAASADVQTYEFTGTVGTHPVGASITVTDDKTIDVGHYFYDSQLKDIPLTGQIAGRTVTLREPGGGVFQLSFEGNGGTGGEGTSFSTSVDLKGTWTQGSQTLPVKLDMDFATQGAPDGHRYADVTNASDAAFEAQVAKFLKAVLAGDKQTAASAVSYPLAVNGKPKLSVRTPAAFVADWNTIFTPKLMAQIRAAVPHEMFVHEGQAMVSGGAVWFDAKGASAINEP